MAATGVVPGSGGLPGTDWMSETDPVLGPQSQETSYRWATVTVSSPLQIQLDGDGLPLPLEPESLMAGIPIVGARVWVQLFGRRVIVLGTSSTGSGESPIGAVLSYAGSAAPVGWMLCNGAAISRTAFAKLFAAIGTNFGVGNGTTTFNLPDLRDRVAVGVGPSRTQASTGGASSVTLTTGQLPGHDHGAVFDHQHGTAGNHLHANNGSHQHNSIGDHLHSINLGPGASQAVTGGTGDFFYASGTRYTDTGGGHTHNYDGDHFHAANGDHFHGNAGGHTHNSVGSGQSHENMPPFQALNSIIRVS